MSTNKKLFDFFERAALALGKISYNKARFLLLILGGVLTGLTLVITEIGIIEWITMIPVGIVLLSRTADRGVRLRSLYLDGFVFFYSFYIVCYHWFLYLYPLEFIDGMTNGAAVAVVLVAWLGLSLLQSLFGGFVFVIAGVLMRSGWLKKLSILKPFVLASLWPVFEWTQTIGWWGVPWGRLPIGQTDYLLGVQNASLFGSYFVTFALVCVNFIIAFILLEPQKIRLGALIVVSVLVFQYGGGALIWCLTDVNDGEKIKAACVQGNIASGEKWSADSFSKTLSNYTKYTIEAAENGAELVIWPETAFPYDISEGYYEMYSTVFANMAKKHGIYILVGAYVSDEEGNQYNSLICFTPKGERHDTVYSKRHLVPFGEFVPMKELIQVIVPPLAELVMSSNEIVAGEGAQIIELDNGIKLGSLICFDSIYESLVYESAQAGAELICLSTNDSWFTTSKALDMHNAQAKLRAIESGRYVVRSANTGISSIIDSRGETLVSLGAREEGTIYHDVYSTDHNTLWDVIGNSFVYVLIAVQLIVFAEAIVKSIYKKRYL